LQNIEYLIDYNLNIDIMCKFYNYISS